MHPSSGNGDVRTGRKQDRCRYPQERRRPDMGLLSFLQSSEQGIRLQTSMGGGIGRFFKNTNSATIAMMAGLGLQRTRYTQSVSPLATQDVGSTLIGIELKLFDIVTDIFPAISDPGRVYVATNASYFVKLFGKLFWNVSSYANVDTRPPAH